MREATEPEEVNQNAGIGLGVNLIPCNLPSSLIQSDEGVNPTVHSTLGLGRSKGSPHGAVRVIHQLYICFAARMNCRS